jgi:uncharacterized protein with NRDE domain
VCTILLAWRCLDDADFVVAANRDELIARPTAPPRRLCEVPPIYGGQDLLAGGTWLAVTPDGRVAAVTNRRTDTRDEVGRDPSRRSRGELPVAILRTPSSDAPRAMRRIRPADYNPFNVLVLDADSALVGHGGGGESLDVVELGPGVHVLCVHNVDDTGHAKEALLRERLGKALRGVRSTTECVDTMTALLGDHATDEGEAHDAVCIHSDTYGTVSASLVISTAGGTMSFRHAPGRPCVSDFAEVRLS